MCSGCTRPAARPTVLLARPRDDGDAPVGGAGRRGDARRSGTAVVTAVGTIPGPDLDVTGGNAGTTTAGWDFGGVFWEPGQTLDPIFLSFSTLTPGDQIRWEFTVIEMGTQTVTAPEPHALLLLLPALVVAARLRPRAPRAGS